MHKRPQTSKGSRKTTKADSEYYEEDDDDLLITNNPNGIDFGVSLDCFKKPNQTSISTEHDSKFTKY